MSRELLKYARIPGCPHHLFPHFLIVDTSQAAAYIFWRMGKCADSKYKDVPDLPNQELLLLCILLSEFFSVSFLSFSPQVAIPAARLCACLCKIHGNADKFIDSRSWRFKKNTRYWETLNSHKTLMFWMMEFPPLPLETSPSQVPVYSCCCYSAVLYFHYKTTPFISFLTSHTEEIQRMEVSQFSITLRNMRLIHSCGPLRVITIVFRKWKGPELLHNFEHI